MNDLKVIGIIILSVLGYAGYIGLLGHFFIEKSDNLVLAVLLGLLPVLIIGLSLVIFY